MVFQIGQSGFFLNSFNYIIFEFQNRLVFQIGKIDAFLKFYNNSKNYQNGNSPIMKFILYLIR